MSTKLIYPRCFLFLMNHELTNALQEAEHSLKETETLLAWRELEISERRAGCDFWLAAGGATPQELKVQLGRFFAIFFSIHEYIQTRPRTTRRKPNERLQELWKRFRALELRMVKPGVIPSGA